MRKLALSAAVALAAACLPPRSPVWRHTEPAFVAPKAGFELVPPPQWMMAGRGDPEFFGITRDGTPLQRISARATEVGKPLDLGGGRRAVVAGMSAQELAELVVDDLRAADGLTELEVLENAPATLSGREGFRLLAAYRSADGLRTRFACYGVLDGGRFYRLSYFAAERHYFDRDLPVFDAIARSFRLRTPSPSPRGP
jgi:hypothetical protein